MHPVLTWLLVFSPGLSLTSGLMITSVLLFFFDKTYLYYWIRKRYIDTYKYKYVLQGYRDSCTDQTAKEPLKESKITLKSPTPMLAFFAGDRRCRTLPSTKTPEPP